MRLLENGQIDFGCGLVKSRGESVSVEDLILLSQCFDERISRVQGAGFPGFARGGSSPAGGGGGPSPSPSPFTGITVSDPAGNVYTGVRRLSFVDGIVIKPDAPGGVILSYGWVNAKSYGATGDGVTNDAPAIQAAIDAIGPQGGILFFPPGTYRVRSSLVLPDKPVIVRGSGAGDAFAGVPRATAFDLGSDPVPLFVVPAGGTFAQIYMLEDFQVVATLVSGQHFYQDLTGTTLYANRLELTGLDRLVDAQGSMEAEFLNCIYISCNTLLDGTLANESEITMIGGGGLLNGPVGTAAGVSVNMIYTNITAFTPCLIHLAQGSALSQTRLDGIDVEIDGGVPNGNVRWSMVDMVFGSLTITGDFNIISASIFDSMTVGIAVNGTRNNLVGLTFTGVTTPITDAGGGTFNLYDAINGFSGSSITDVNSVVGTKVN